MGFRPRRSTAASLATSSAEAPSLICELFPAVSTPSFSKAGFSPLRVSTVVSGRIPSSSLKTLVFPFTVNSKGAISSPNHPLRVASSALR